MSTNNNSKKSVDGQMNGHQNNKFKKYKNKVYDSRFESSDKQDKFEKSKEIFKPVKNQIYDKDVNLVQELKNNTNENNEYRPRQNNRNYNNEYRPRHNFNNKNEFVESTIKVNNLDKSFNEDSLHELFSYFGRITRISLPKDDKNGQSKGFAYIAFSTRSEAENAFEKLQGHAFGHLLLRLEWAQSYKQKSNNGEYRPRQNRNDDGEYNQRQNYNNRNDNSEYRPRQNYNNNRNFNKFEKKDPETIEEIEKLLSSGKFLHQNKKEELEKKLSYLKECSSPQNQFPTLPSNSETLNISSNNPWSKTKESKVMSDEGIKEANEIAKKLYIENINKKKLKQLELKEKKDAAKKKLSYEQEYYGDEFFDEDEEQEDYDNFCEEENFVPVYDESYEQDI